MPVEAHNRYEHSGFDLDMGGHVTSNARRLREGRVAEIRGSGNTLLRETGRSRTRSKNGNKRFANLTRSL